MKKLTVLILTAVLLCIVFAGCRNDVLDQDENDQSNYVPELVIIDYDKEEVIDGFEMKGKLFLYSENSPIVNTDGKVLILDATNTTENNYSVKIRITFFDENGEKIRKESKSIREFPAGHSQYVVFKSCPDYTTYETEIVLTEYIGDTYADHISFKIFTEVRDLPFDPANGIFIEYSTLVAQSSFEFDCPNPEMYVNYDVILFDKTGAVYTIFDRGTKANEQTEHGYSEYSSYKLLTASDEKSEVEIPDELAGDIHVIFSLESIKYYE